MEGTTSVLTADQLRARSIKRVTLPDGAVVVIARLAPARLMAAGGGLLDLANLDRDDIRRLTDPTAKGDPKRTERALESMERIVQAGVVEPALALERTPDGPPTPGDFTLDELSLLFGEILDFCGFTKEAAKAIRPS